MNFELDKMCPIVNPWNLQNQYSIPTSYLSVERIENLKSQLTISLESFLSLHESCLKDKRVIELYFHDELIYRGLIKNLNDEILKYSVKSFFSYKHNILRINLV